MNPSAEIPFAESKQERSQKTLEDILEAAEQIVQEADPNQFTSRSLAQKSGYALGTLVRRLSSIENVFLWAVKKGRDNKLQEFAISVTQFDADTTIHTFAENMIDIAFSEIQRVNPAVMRFFENRYTKMNGLPPDYFTYMDLLAQPYLVATSKNQTDTFRDLSATEASLLIRQICSLVERPFIEGNPIAGTRDHRRIAIDMIVRLLGK
jgi:AcrR family transcriptional regulator